MNNLTHITLQGIGRSHRIAAKIKHVSDSYIVFVHGWACSQECFEGAFEFPGFEDYSICTFDLLGHGLSDKPQGFSYSMEDHAAVTSELLVTLKARDLNLVGHSMGGLVALLADDRLGVQVTSLISVEGNLAPEDAGVRIRAMVRQPLPVFKSVGAKAMQAMMALSPDKNTRKWARWWGETLSEAIYSEAKSIIQWSDSGKLLPAFRTIDDRTYMVGKLSDKVATVSQLGPGEVIELPRSGHFPMFDNPTDFYNAIAACVRK